MHLLTVDPGIRGCGVALFLDGALVSATYIANPIEPSLAWSTSGWCTLARAVVAWTHRHGARGETGDVALIETMRVYTYGHGRSGDPADLFQVQGVCGAVAAWLDAAGGWTSVGVPAVDWNGQTPREVQQPRTMKWIDERRERPLVDLVGVRKSLHHNAWSALGLARWYLAPGRNPSAVRRGLPG